MKNTILLNKKDPFVSVCMITFNHDKFIEQSVLSVVKQQTNFSFEIIIGDDCSTDNTRSILLKLKNQFPNTIKLIFNDKNIGPVHNFGNVLKSCHGKYIALLEGDDYWNSYSKIQKQVDFLECHTNYSICFHATNLVNKYGEIKTILPIEKFRKERSTLIDLIENDSFMATCSVMFRSGLYDYFPNIFYTSRFVCDWSLHVLNAEHGYIGYIDEIMSVYRSSSNEHAWSSKKINEQYVDSIKINQEFNRYFNFKYNNAFKRKISEYYLTIGLDYYKYLEFDNGTKSIIKSFKNNFNISIFFKTMVFQIPKSIVKGLIKIIIKIQ